MKIVCSGSLIRYPLGGLAWHHLQYLVGLHRMGHEVIYVEDHGWPRSCFDPSTNRMTSDPAYGIASLRRLLRMHGLEERWCYLAEDGTAHGMAQEDLAQLCRDSDLHLNLSNVNWIPELGLCRRRVLVDTDPVFTQIGALGQAPIAAFHVHFTFGENVHRPECEMPTADVRWQPTRQPVVLDLWAVGRPDPAAAVSTVMSWDPIGVQRFGEQVFGGKSREFEAFFALPNAVGEKMEIAVGLEPKYCDPPAVRRRLANGGWRVVDPLEVAPTPEAYQDYLCASRAEFSVAKHGYVVTRCGWFSERSTAYMASGRPVVVQDTGFSRFLPCGEGLLPFRDGSEAVHSIRQLRRDPEVHGRAARALVEEYFDARRVLADLLEKSQ